MVLSQWGYQALISCHLRLGTEPAASTVAAQSFHSVLITSDTKAAFTLQLVIQPVRLRRDRQRKPTSVPWGQRAIMRTSEQNEIIRHN